VKYKYEIVFDYCLKLKNKDKWGPATCGDHHETVESDREMGTEELKQIVLDTNLNKRRDQVWFEYFDVTLEEFGSAYEILSHAFPDSLQSIVREYMGRGYKPVGGVAVSLTGSRIDASPCFHQAVYKEEE
jgi:hypothetical protein